MGFYNWVAGRCTLRYNVYMGVDESDLLLANAEVLARNEIGKRYRGMVNLWLPFI